MVLSFGRYRANRHAKQMEIDARCAQYRREAIERVTRARNQSDSRSTSSPSTEASSTGWRDPVESLPRFGETESWKKWEAFCQAAGFTSSEHQYSGSSSIDSSHAGDTSEDTPASSATEAEGDSMGVYSKHFREGSTGTPTSNAPATQFNTSSVYMNRTSDTSDIIDTQAEGDTSSVYSNRTSDTSEDIDTQAEGDTSSVYSNRAGGTGDIIDTQAEGDTSSVYLNRAGDIIDTQAEGDTSSVYSRQSREASESTPSSLNASYTEFDTSSVYSNRTSDTSEVIDTQAEGDTSSVYSKNSREGSAGTPSSHNASHTEFDTSNINSVATRGKFGILSVDSSHFQEDIWVICTPLAAETEFDILSVYSNHANETNKIIPASALPDSALPDSALPDSALAALAATAKAQGNTSQLNAQPTLEEYTASFARCLDLLFGPDNSVESRTSLVCIEGVQSTPRRNYWNLAAWWPSSWPTLLQTDDLSDFDTDTSIDDSFEL